MVFLSSVFMLHASALYQSFGQTARGVAREVGNNSAKRREEVPKAPKREDGCLPHRSHSLERQFCASNHSRDRSWFLNPRAIKGLALHNLA